MIKTVKHPHDWIVKRHKYEPDKIFWSCSRCKMSEDSVIESGLFNCSKYSFINYIRKQIVEKRRSILRSLAERIHRLSKY